MTTTESNEDSTFTAVGVASIPTDEVVLPTYTHIQTISPYWFNEDEVMADPDRPSPDHCLVMAAVWVPRHVLDES